MIYDSPESFKRGKRIVDKAKGTDTQPTYRPCLDEEKVSCSRYSEREAVLCCTKVGHIDSDNCKPLAKNIDTLTFAGSTKRKFEGRL